MTKNQALKSLSIPKVYCDFVANWELKEKRERCLEKYQSGSLSFVPNLLPEHVLQLTVVETIEILQARLGEKFKVAFDHLNCVESPVVRYEDGSWLTRSNVVGINIRTVGSYAG